MSLPFFEDFGWEAEIVCVAERYTDAVFDHLLTESIPSTIRVHRVKALHKKWTSKFGLGSLALRSLPYYKSYVNKLLKTQHFDLIYFSTTQFPVCILGNYWKKKFNVPYVIDMQDPWFSDYYQDKPKHQRPKKYWFSYRLDKYLEPFAMKNVDGLIAVSKAYIDDLKSRYKNLEKIPTAVITFGGFLKDLEIAAAHQQHFELAFDKNPNLKHLVYVGRGGYDMRTAVYLLFSTFKKGLENFPDLFSQLRFHFIGTSYAPLGQGIRTLYAVAKEIGVEDYVFEQSDRISFYESLYNLQSADALIIPGHEQAAYTASKIYPYILCKKPILAIFNRESNAAQTLENCKAGTVANINNAEEAEDTIYSFLEGFATNKLPPVDTNWEEFEQFMAKPKTEKQCKLFNSVVV
ncbi:MAG: hypothetical protein EOO91_01675 [Pedobacter sp.]|nr:MAG: hypothetical protein EOO91_01675 [Pedobacter sp.]